MAQIDCIYCGENNDSVKSLGFCEACGKQLPDNRGAINEGAPGLGGERRSSEEDKRIRDEERFQVTHDSTSGREESAKRRAARIQTSLTLFAMATVQLICGSVGLLFLGKLANESRAGEVFLLLTAIEVAGSVILFTLLGFWALYEPLIPAIIGLVLFVCYNAMILVVNWEMVAKSGYNFIFKGIILLFLIIAVSTASKAK